MNQTRSIHVVIADDHSIIREGLAAVINREPDMEVVAQACDWPEAVQYVLQNHPEIAVLDLHMRGMEPVAGVATLREKFPATQIIIFSAFGTDEDVFQILRAGARGYVLKGESGREDLLTCLRSVSRGEIWIHPAAAARLAERLTTPTLTDRELEVLRRMALGKSNKEIGAALDVTEGTVKVHVNHILSKLGVTGRVEAIMVAARRGLISLAESQAYPGRSAARDDNRAGNPSSLAMGYKAKAAGAGSSSSQGHVKK